MRYQDKTFTLPVSGKKISDEKYEIAVGIRCATCKKKMEKCKCK